MNYISFFQKYFPIYLTHWMWTLVLAFQLVDLVLLTAELAKQKKSAFYETRYISLMTKKLMGAKRQMLMRIHILEN